MFSVILGAFGAHAFKEKLNPAQIKNFETGVKYQMYHALLLIILGITFPLIGTLQVIMAWCFILGTFLFSFSIYGLVLSGAYGKKLRFLGPVTPLGGLLIVMGWILFTFNSIKIAQYL